MDWLPIADRENTGSLTWHPELVSFITEFAEQSGVLEQLARRLRPSSWMGGLASHLEQVLLLVEGWLYHPNATVRSWAATKSDHLRKEIAGATKRCEEDMIGVD